MAITKIIFDNQADWFGIYDEAIIIKEGYENYVAKIFGEKTKNESNKNSK